MDKYKFGNKLTEYRTERGLTQSELGEILGVSNKAVSKWENGSAMPRLDMMSKITDYFGVSMDEFLDIPSDKKSTNEELEQKYLKLYNEKMKRRKIIKTLLFVVLPVLIILSTLFYVFGPVFIVKMKYNSLPDYAKRKPEKFNNYDMVFYEDPFSVTTSFAEVNKIIMALPLEYQTEEKTSNYEKKYFSDDENAPCFRLLYSEKDDIQLPFDNRKNWFADNYGTKIDSIYDLKNVLFSSDFSDIKIKDWKKAVTSYKLLTLKDIYTPMNDKIIMYNGENAKGFITVKSNEESDTIIYVADLYNDNGECLTITYTGKSLTASEDYETICKVINSVQFPLSDEEREQRRLKDLEESQEYWNEQVARRKNDLPYVTPNPDLEILKAEEVTTLSLKAGMDENDIINTLGEPNEIEYVSEDGFNKKIYVYDGVRIIFLKEYLGEPYMDEIWSAEITDPDAVFPRDIKIGDSLESILKKLPQERDKDYRLDGKVYGDGMYKFTGGFAIIKEQEENGEPQQGSYQLNVSCGYWPEIDFIFDDELNVERVIIYYISMGIG